mgnify:CR=1 FL=1
MTTLTFIEIDHDTFNDLPHAKTRLVLTDSAERRDLIDDTGKVIAFSQRTPTRDGMGRTSSFDRNNARHAERAVKFYAVRTEQVRQVLP